MAIVTKSTWQIFAVKGAASNIYLWQITNLITGNVYLFPVAYTTLTTQVSSPTDYNFIFRQDQLRQLDIPIIDVKYIGNGSGTPNYGNPSTDLASILALI